MKRESGLFHQVVSWSNLLRAFQKAFRGKKNRASLYSFYFHLESELLDLQKELIEGLYQPKKYHIFEIQDPKVRKICSSDFRDRVVHHALCNVLEPYFERRLIFHTYACRVGKGSHAAVRKCQNFIKGNEYFLKCDIRKYFESIDHALLKNLLRRILKDPGLLGLMDTIINHPVLGNEKGKGLPIGNLTSQYFANLYLGELDHFLKEDLKIKSYLRYMDDFIIFGPDKTSLHSILDQTREFLGSKLKLTLKEKVVKIAPVSEGVPFLGFRIFKSLIRLQRSNLLRVRRRIKKSERDYIKGKISEKVWVQSVASRIAHISHANTFSLRSKEFEPSIGLA